MSIDTTTSASGERLHKSPAAGILSLGYAVGRLAHRGLYEVGLKRRERLPRPVICIGNLTVGGTGKTPFLITLARELSGRGLRLAILSRGYGAEPTAREPRLVSDTEKTLLDPVQAGDEPFLLARQCPGVLVVIGASRAEAGRFALDKFDIDLFLLDDGFQHEALARDADLVLWDMRDLPSASRQLPAGRLREGLSALRRAKAVILTHREYLPMDSAEARECRVVAELKRAAPEVPIFAAETTLSGYRPLLWDDTGSNHLQPMTDLRGVRVLLLSGLARPEGFENLVRTAGINVADHLKFADHARYDARTIDAVAEKLKETGAGLVLTTEKDAVKLERLETRGLPIFAASLAMAPRESERWEPFLEHLLEFIQRAHP